MTTATIEDLLSTYRTASSFGQRLHIARDVAGRGPAATAAFGILVDDADPRVALAAAHHLLDFMTPAAEIRDRALLVIERAATVRNPEALGEMEWLENWRAEQQNE